MSRRFRWPCCHRPGEPPAATFRPRTARSGPLPLNGRRRSDDDDIVRREHIAQRDAEIARRKEEEGGTGFIPIILTVLILLGVGYFAYSFMYPGHVSVAPRTTENTLPRTVTPAPAPTVPPVAPATK